MYVGKKVTRVDAYDKVIGRTSDAFPLLLSKSIIDPVDPF